MLMFMIVFGIHCIFFIALDIRLKTCRSNALFFSTRQNVPARIIGHVLYCIVVLLSLFQVGIYSSIKTNKNQPSSLYKN